MENTSSNMDTSSVEFTLEETYEQLKEVKNERDEVIKKLMSIVQNNQVQTLGHDVTPALIRQKRAQFVQSMQKFVAFKQPKDLSVPNTYDFYADALLEMGNAVTAMEKLCKNTDEEINELKTDINYMENKLATFKEMKETLAADDNDTNNNYEAEMLIAKQLFQKVKKDLQITVDKLFPENIDFQELLCILTRALTKGGDDLYITVKPDHLDFINFLEDAALVQLHPNDKRKVKLMEF